MSEINIQDLLDTINRDGIQKAEEQANQIVFDANNKAKEIISLARKEADDIIKKAKNEKEIFVEQGKIAVSQACDSACVSLKTELNKIIGAVVKKNLSPVLRNDSLFELVKEAIKDNPSKNIILEFSSSAYELASNLLYNEIEKGLEIKVNDSIKEGFRITEKDGSGYYDFSSDELVAIIMPYISESVRKAVSK